MGHNIIKKILTHKEQEGLLLHASKEKDTSLGIRSDTLVIIFILSKSLDKRENQRKRGKLKAAKT